MRASAIATVSLATGAAAWAVPAFGSADLIASRAAGGCDAPVQLNASTNIWQTYSLHPNVLYRELVEAAIPQISDATLKKRAERAADTGTFVWIEGPGQIPRIEKAVKNVPCNQTLGLVISGLQHKQCIAKGEAPKGEEYDYQKGYIDQIARIIQAHANTAFALIVEPEVIGNFVLNSNPNVTAMPNVDPNVECAHVAASYRKNVPYALRKLNLPNVILYLDAEHGGVFGWRDWIKPGTKELLDTVTAAGTPGQFRGFATNVKGYNGWDLSPGETFKNDPWDCLDASTTSVSNPARNEKTYLTYLSQELKKLNYSLPFHAVVDTSRSGVQGVRLYWDDWCNINGASFGYRPNMKPTDEKVDAWVWAKWAGESDGTSDSQSVNFHANCANETAFRPMPEKGQWSQGYFESMLRDWRGSGI